jgi:hypothetical protein
MSRSDSLFREVPDKDQVIAWLKEIKIDGLTDSHTFTEATFPFDAFNQVLLEAEPFYFPCKARTYLHRSMNMKRAMTVLRQLVRPHGYTFMTHERLQTGQKYNEYYLMPEVSFPLAPITVNTIEFN